MSLETLFAGTPARPPRQFDGPQEGAVLSVSPAGELFVTVDALGRDVRVGPCRWARPLEAHQHGAGTLYTPPLPPVGTRCLVLFAGAGAGRPWVAAFDGWPA